MNQPGHSDDDLHELLQTWQVAPRHDPALARSVWARVAEDRPTLAAGWLDHLARWLAYPLPAAAAILAFAAIGVLAGEWHSATQRHARVDRLAAQYAHSIDPVLMTQVNDHAGPAP